MNVPHTILELLQRELAAESIPLERRAPTIEHLATAFREIQQANAIGLLTQSLSAVASSLPDQIAAALAARHAEQHDDEPRIAQHACRVDGCPRPAVLELRDGRSVAHCCAEHVPSP